MFYVGAFRQGWLGALFKTLSLRTGIASKSMIKTVCKHNDGRAA